MVHLIASHDEYKAFSRWLKYTGDERSKALCMMAYVVSIKYTPKRIGAVKRLYSKTQVRMVLERKVVSWFKGEQAHRLNLSVCMKRTPADNPTVSKVGGEAKKRLRMTC